MTCLHAPGRHAPAAVELIGVARPLDRLRGRDHRHGYGLVLLLVLASACFQVASPSTSWSRFITIVLGAATLLAAMVATETRHGLGRAVATAALGLAAISGAFWLVTGSIPQGEAAIANGLLVAFAPVLIVRGILRDMRREGAVTVHALSGVLAIYLLLGMFFSFLYGAVDGLSDNVTFNGAIVPERSDFLYFSYITQATVGYGDITPATDVTRMFAVAQALTGQVYLVTVVALIITNLRPRRSRPAGGASARVTESPPAPET
jgi:Ion channel